jgi:hypothetical protein
MKIINLGGVGGCDITQAIQRILTVLPRYPYDWLLTNQSFIIRTLLDNKCFFNFEDKTKLHGKEVHVEEMDGMSVHDFPDSFDETEHKRLVPIIKEKYERRMERMNDALFSEESILFVRLSNNTETSKDWINRFHCIRDDYFKWAEFTKYLNTYFKKPIYLLIITTNEEEYRENRNTDYENVIVRFFDDKNIEDTDLRHYLLSLLINDIYKKIN